jgi:hypothetical protein
VCSNYLEIRHECNEADNVVFGWEQHDGARYGKQVMKDYEGRFNMSTEFVSFNDFEWSVRIKAESMDDEERHIGLMYYWALEDSDDVIELLSKSSSQGIHSDDVILSLNFGTAGSYQMHIRKRRFSFSICDFFVLNFYRLG